MHRDHIQNAAFLCAKRTQTLQSTFNIHIRLIERAEGDTLQAEHNMRCQRIGIHKQLLFFEKSVESQILQANVSPFLVFSLSLFIPLSLFLSLIRFSSRKNSFQRGKLATFDNFMNPAKMPQNTFVDVKFQSAKFSKMQLNSHF